MEAACASKFLFCSGHMIPKDEIKLVGLTDYRPWFPGSGGIISPCVTPSCYLSVQWH